jgi:predicted DNA-binding protein YlxM (UPF0122 family)
MPKRPEVILRKKVERASSLSEEDTSKLIYDSVYSGLSDKEIAEKYDVTEDVIHSLVQRFRKDLNNITETKLLIKEQGTSHFDRKRSNIKRTVVHPEIINEAFKELLSDDNDPILSDAEHTYCWVYTATGNNEQALKEAKLNAGLFQHTGKGESVALINSMKLRGYYLRGKPNVRDFIIELRERELKQHKVANKEYIQSNLVQEITQMKEEGDPRNRQSLLKAIELFGKTIPGCFSDTIRVQDVKPDEALDALLEMAKAEVKALPAGSAVDESWEIIEQ